MRKNSRTVQTSRQSTARRKQPARLLPSSIPLRTSLNGFGEVIFFFFFDFLVWCKLPIYFLYLQIKRVMRYNPIEEIDERMIAADVPVADLCTRAGLSYTTFYRWLQNPPRTLQLINRLHDELETLEAERGITATNEKLCNACGAIVAAVPQPQDAAPDDQPSGG